MSPRVQGAADDITDDFVAAQHQGAEEKSEAFPEEQDIAGSTSLASPVEIIVRNITPVPTNLAAREVPASYLRATLHERASGQQSQGCRMSSETHRQGAVDRTRSDDEDADGFRTLAALWQAMTPPLPLLPRPPNAPPAASQIKVAHRRLKAASK